MPLRFGGRLQCIVACAALLLTVAPLQTRADNTPGGLGTITNGGSVPRDLFSISGSKLTVNGDPTEMSKWFITGTATGLTANQQYQLLGISKIFLVAIDPVTSDPSPGPGTVANGGYVALNAASGTHTPWLTDTQNLYARYKDVSGAAAGFSPSDPYIVIGNSGANVLNTFGSFTFDSSLVDAGGNLKYDIGFDYSVKVGTGTATGRDYFHIKPAPEFGSVFSLGGLLLAGCTGIWIQRRRSTRTAPRDIAA